MTRDEVNVPVLTSRWHRIRQVRVLGAAFTLAALIGIITVLRHQRFLSSTYDMGFYIHDVWRIAHGSWSSSIFGFHVFADHFSPIMVLLAPLAYFSTAEGLLAVQAVAVGSTVIPAFRFGSRIGGERMGWRCVLWVGLSVSVWNTVMYDFRPATLGFVALIWLISEMETERRMWLIGTLCALAASAREDVAVLAGVAVLMQSWFLKDRRLAILGGFTAGVGLWYTVAGQRLFAPFDYFLWYRYADYGDTPLQALANFDYALPTALGRLGRAEVLVAFLALLGPFLVVPAIKGLARSWPGVLIMIGNGISGAAYIPTIYYQYYIAAVAFLMWGGAHVMARPSNYHWVRSAALATVAVFLAVGPVASLSNTPYGRTVPDVVLASDRKGLGDGIAPVPDHASVSAGNALLPHLAERTEIYSFPVPLKCGELIQRYTPKTAFPSYVVVEEHEAEATDINLTALGYQLISESDQVAVWRSTGDHPPSHPCPSPGATKDALFERVSRQGGR